MHGRTNRWPSLTRAACAALFTVFTGHSATETRFDRVVIDNNFPDGYQVEVADVNGDRKPDIIALGGSTCAWYENPTWKKRIVTAGKQTPGIISSATADLDGDGKAEIAIAYDFEMNEPTRGKLALAVQGSGSDEPWKLVPDRRCRQHSPPALGRHRRRHEARPGRGADLWSQGQAAQLRRQGPDRGLSASRRSEDRDLASPAAPRASGDPRDRGSTLARHTGPLGRSDRRQ